MLKKISAAFTGGVVAALLMAVLMWYLGRIGFFSRIGVSLRPELSSARLFIDGGWGGLWGLLFMLPVLKAQIVVRGLVLALPPAVFVLCYRMPHEGHGVLGLNYGDWAPLVILVSWLFWGVVGAFWYKSAA